MVGSFWGLCCTIFPNDNHKTQVCVSFHLACFWGTPCMVFLWFKVKPINSAWFMDTTWGLSWRNSQGAFSCLDHNTQSVSHGSVLPSTIKLPLSTDMWESACGCGWLLERVFICLSFCVCVCARNHFRSVDPLWLHYAPDLLFCRRLLSF